MSEAKCASCGAVVGATDAFCRQCGTQRPQASAEQQAMHWCFCAETRLGEAIEGMIPEQRAWTIEGNIARANLVAAAPPVLGPLVLRARFDMHEYVGRPVGPEHPLMRVVMTINGLRKQTAEPLNALFSEIAAGRRRRGFPRRAEMGKTTDDLVEELKVAHTHFERGDYDEAERMCRELLDIDPELALASNLLAGVYSTQGRVRDALGELLWAFHLLPDSPTVTCNLLRELTAADLHATALDVHLLHRQLRPLNTPSRGEQEMEASRNIEGYAELARACTTMYACRTAEVGPGDVSAEGIDPLDSQIFLAHAWVTEPLAGKHVFISYRHADGTDVATKLREGLAGWLPSSNVYLDTSSMQGAREFPKQIGDWISDSSAVVALITPYWTSKEGIRKLQDPGDIVRRELELAFREYKLVIPVCVDDVPVDQLRFPDTLAKILDVHMPRLSAAQCRFPAPVLVALTARALERSREDRQLRDLETTLRRGQQQEMRADIDTIEKIAVWDELPRELTGGAANPGLDFVVVDGHWECCRTLANDHRTRVEFAVGQRRGSLVVGTWQEGDEPPQRFDGFAARVVPSSDDISRICGIYVKASLADGSVKDIVFPFLQKVGNSYVAEYPGGRSFRSRNVDPRPDGF